MHSTTKREILFCIFDDFVFNTDGEWFSYHIFILLHSEHIVSLKLKQWMHSREQFFLLVLILHKCVMISKHIDEVNWRPFEGFLNLILPIWVPLVMLYSQWKKWLDFTWKQKLIYCEDSTQIVSKYSVYGELVHISHKNVYFFKYLWGIINNMHLHMYSIGVNEVIKWQAHRYGNFSSIPIMLFWLK